MSEFPVARLKPSFAKLFMGNLNQPALEIHFEPFSVQDQFEGEILSDAFDRPLMANFIALPSVDVAELSGRCFEFPLNPDDGYIDASVYFRDRHNPVDISRLEFAKDADGRIILTVASRWLMTLEGSASNDFDYMFTVPMRA